MTSLAVSIGTANADAGAAAGLDLGVDADDLAPRVEQRAARVAGLRARVGLDDVGDAEAAGRGDPLRRVADTTPGGQRARRASGCRARPSGRRRARRCESPSWSGCRSWPSVSTCSSARSVSGSEPSSPPADERVGERDVELGGAGDHVRVGDDRPVVVDHEAGARRLAAAAAGAPTSNGAVGRGPSCAHEDDAGRRRARRSPAALEPAPSPGRGRRGAASRGIARRRPCRRGAGGPADGAADSGGDPGPDPAAHRQPRVRRRGEAAAKRV